MNEQVKQRLRSTLKQFGLVSRMYQRYKESRQIHAEPVQTPLGFRLVGNLEMQQGVFEPEETRMVGSLLDQAEVLINVGANIGYYCAMALQRNKHVVAFEPMAQNLHSLYRNLRANGWESGVEVYPIALSNFVGLIQIYGGGTGASLVKGWADTPESHVTTVPCSTLNNVVGNRFSGKQCFVLVDIEGAERWMIQGASAVLTMEPRPVWMLEIAITEHQPKGVSINPNLMQTFQVFWDSGYVALTADEQSREVTSTEVQAIVDSGVDTLKTHNFIFIEHGQKSRFIPD